MKETHAASKMRARAIARQTIQSNVYSRLEETPERRAIGFLDAQGEISWLTLEQLCNEASERAAWLAESGLRRGDVCILVLPSDRFCATVLLSTLLLGAVPLLVAPPVVQGLQTSLPDTLTRLIRKTRARIVIAGDFLAGQEHMLKRMHPRTRFLFDESDRWRACASLIPMAEPSETDVAAMQLTSGTTGTPRICVWQQKNVMAALDGMATAMRLSPQDICLNWTPLYHDMGLVNNFLTCLTKGITQVMMSPVDFIKKPALWLRGLSQTGATITWSPNFGFAVAARRVTNQEMQGVNLSGVRAFWNAAERIHLETIEAFYGRFAPFGVRWEALKTNFGCAENIGGGTFTDPESNFLVEHVDRATLQEKGVALPSSDLRGSSKVVPIVGVGRPYPELKIQILSRTGRLLPDGYVGEVALDTPSRMTGYVGQAKATQRAIHGKLLRTGDLGYLRGQELFWVGRLRERITIRGIKLDPSEFEPVLTDIAGLRAGSYVVFGIDDPKQGTQRLIVAAEVLETTSRNHQDLIAEVRERLLLRLGVMVDEVILQPRGTLVKTSSGKRRHRHFQQLYKKGELRPWVPEEASVTPKERDVQISQQEGKSAYARQL